MIRFASTIRLLGSRGKRITNTILLGVRAKSCSITETGAIMVTANNTKEVRCRKFPASGRCNTATSKLMLKCETNTSLLCRSSVRCRPAKTVCPSRVVNTLMARGIHSINTRLMGTGKRTCVRPLRAHSMGTSNIVHRYRRNHNMRIPNKLGNM